MLLKLFMLYDDDVGDDDDGDYDIDNDDDYDNNDDDDDYVRVIPAVTE